MQIRFGARVATARAASKFCLSCYYPGQIVEEVGGIDCLGSSIAFAMAGKVDVPKPSRLRRRRKLVPVPLWIVGKLVN